MLQSMPLISLMLFPMACRPEEKPLDTDVPAPPGDFLQGFVPKNVVILHTDTLRWDHTPWYGYGRETFPLLSARSGWVRWERMYSTSGWTAPSTASFFTAQDIHHHGVRMTNDEVGDDLLGPVLGDWYQQQGYATGLVSGNILFLEDSGMTRGWQSATVDDHEPMNASANTAAALSWLDSLPAAQPFVLHMQAFDPHAAWYPAEEDQGTYADLSVLPFALTDSSDDQRTGLTRALREVDAAAKQAMLTSIVGLYDEELLGLDRSLEQLLQGLEARGLLADTLIVFTADHGETLFDRGDTFGHGSSLFEEQHRIPLVFYNPALTDQSVDGCLGSNVDVHPTLLQAMGLPVPDGIDGVPLQEQCRAFTTGSIYRDLDTDGVVAPLQITIQTTEWKLLRDCERRESLYHISSDPGSIRPIQDSADAPVEGMRKELDAFMVEVQEKWPDVSCGAGP